jgi:hypothetical protein
MRLTAPNSGGLSSFGACLPSTKPKRCAPLGRERRLWGLRSGTPLALESHHEIDACLALPKAEAERPLLGRERRLWELRSGTPLALEGHHEVDACLALPKAEAKRPLLGRERRLWGLRSGTPLALEGALPMTHGMLSAKPKPNASFKDPTEP